MERDYVAEYASLLNETVTGIRLRAFFMGYNSQRVEDYLSNQKSKIWKLQDEAYQEKQRIHTKKNLDLETKLFSLDVIMLRCALDN